MEVYSVHFPLALVGIIFVLAGIIMLLFPPKNINFLYGYRTNRSMKTQENWDFSQIYSAKLLVGFGLFLLVLFFSTNHLYNFLPNKEYLDFGIIIVSTILLLYLTEKALKDKFP